MPRFHTRQVNPKVANGDRLAVEREFQGLRYHCLSHVHLLAFDHVEYGAWGFVGVGETTPMGSQGVPSTVGSAWSCAKSRSTDQREGIFTQVWAANNA